MIPTELLFRVYPGAAGFNSFRKVTFHSTTRAFYMLSICSQNIQLAWQHIEDSKRQNLSPEKVDENATSSIFRHIVSGDMPESERSVERLSREAMVLFGAGTATTARTMGFMSYYILRNPHMRKRLGNELKDIMSGYPENPPKWSDLEKLPYLQAIIKEGLR